MISRNILNPGNGNHKLRRWHNAVLKVTLMTAKKWEVVRNIDRHVTQWVMFVDCDHSGSSIDKYHMVSGDDIMMSNG